jgi:type I restriction enzyme, S subunit
MDVKPGYKHSEVGIIPEDWEARPLKGRVSISHGFAFSSKYFVDRGNFRLTTPGHFFEEGGFRDIGEKQKFYVGLVPSQYVLHCGDMIVAMTEQADGLLGSAALIPDEGYLHNQRLGRVTILSSEVEFRYLLYVFNSPSYRANVHETAAGTKVKHTSPGKLLEIPVRLPPAAEQRAIAVALGDVDALLDGLDRLIAKKRDLKLAATQQLLMGKRRLPGFTGNWEVKPLGSVVDTDPENLGSDTQSDFTFNYIALEDVDRGVLRGYSEQTFAKAPSRARRRLRRDDVLVSTVRPNLQSHLLFAGDLGNWVCSTGFCVVRCREGVTNPRFVYCQLFAERVKRQIEALLTGSNYPAINSGDVRALEIPIPNYDEQSAIADVLMDMDAELAALEQRRDKTRDLKQGMMQELLTGRKRLI